MIFELILTVCIAATDGNETCDSAVIDAAPELAQCLGAMDANRPDNANRYLSCRAAHGYVLNPTPTSETPRQLVDRIGDALEAGLIADRDFN